MNKKKIYNTLVVGSGLSSLFFIDSYLEKNNKIDVISFDNKKVDTSKSNNKHIFKILPPQMIGQNKKVNDYFFFNKIKVDPSCKFFGSLEFGGLSNYWGLQIDKNIEQDIAYLNKKTQNKISRSFKEIFEKYNLLGKINKKHHNSFEKNKYIDESILKSKKDLIFEEPILAFQKKAKIKVELNKINEKKDKLTPLNFFRNINKKKIIFHNFFVKKIENHKKGILLKCSNGIEEKIFLTKKLILGCGTLVTTKLMMDYLKIKKEVRINHHPRLFSLYVSKKKWKGKMDFQPSQFHLKSRNNPFLFTADFRPGNKIIVDAIIKFKKILKPIKFLINMFREHFIFSNIFLEPKFGNLFIKRNEDFYEVYSKRKNLNKIFKTTSKIVFDYLMRANKILPFYHNYFPGFGADFHYFGTIPMMSKGKLSVNESCQLKPNKNIYIIDGSVLNFKKNKYPLGLIIANSRRIGKEI